MLYYHHLFDVLVIAPISSQRNTIILFVLQTLAVILLFLLDILSYHLFDMLFNIKVSMWIKTNNLNGSVSYYI